MTKAWTLAILLQLLSTASCRPTDNCPVVTFSCPPLPPLTEPAKDVYSLRPQDIKVVMALGDSVTAGFGLMGSQGSLVGDVQEYRGQAWSMGSDANASTVATFLRFYTPAIIGGSLGNHIVELCYDILCPPFQYEPQKDVFNSAQSGAMIPNLVTHEFDYLYAQLTSNPEVDMANDWKLLTVFVGINDLCLGLAIFCKYTMKLFCTPPTSLPYPLSPTSQSSPFLTSSGFISHKLMTTVYLLITHSLSTPQSYYLSLQSPHCSEIHRIFPIECDCAYRSGTEGDKLRSELQSLITQYNEKMVEIASYYSQKHYSDFAVVVQPFLSNAQAANFTIDFLSTLDCFHPSLCGHQHMAQSLWNNMLTPIPNKKDYIDLTDPVLCPTNATLLYTY
eukprot:Em0018g865a